MRLMTLLAMAAMFAAAGPGIEAAFPALPAAPENRYGLTTEAQLTPQHRSVIERWFVEHGRSGTFPSDRGGVLIHYRAFPVPNEKGAIVLVSGRTESMLVYAELIWDLHRLNYSVYIHDHRGQGFSGGRLRDHRERGYVVTFDDYVADLEKLVRTVVQPQRHRNLYLLAHSMGGGIATLYLEKPAHAGTFKAAALVTPMHEPLLPIKGKDVTESICGIENKFGGWLDQANYVRGTPDYTVTPFRENDLTHSKVRYEMVQKVYTDRPALRVQWPTRGWVRQACLAGTAARDNAAKVSIPVLLLQASRDTAVRADGQVEFCSRVQRPGVCQPWIVEQAYHAVFIEADTFRIPALTKVLDFFGPPDRR